MKTPWGDLGSLDLSNHETCRAILALDKHQLAEGLVVESVFDQIFDQVPSHLPGALLLEVDTAIVDPGRGAQWLAFVWSRGLQPGLKRYLMALEKIFRVWLVETDDPLTTFWTREWKAGKFASPFRPLSDVMGELSGRQPKLVQVADAVRDTNRQLQSFWGFLSSQYGPALGHRVILPRLFMNFGIQPWFRAVWNLDRVLVHGNDIWLLEIKHKYPMAGPPLAFGLNSGELNVIRRLGEAGIRCLHTIVVKPIWSKEAGSMYLLNDMGLRERAALIGVDLDEHLTASMLAGKQGTSAGHTTFSGSGNLNYRVLGASAFSQLGLLSDAPRALAENVARLISRASLTGVEDRWLKELAGRMPSTPRASAAGSASAPDPAPAATIDELKEVQHDSRTMRWGAGDRSFELTSGRARSTLVVPGTGMVELSNAEWLEVADAIRLLVKKGSKKQAADRSGTDTDMAPAPGARWSMAHDQQLRERWSDGHSTVEDLMIAFNRNEGGIVSRLVKLGIVETRDGVLAESRRRTQRLDAGDG